jgi:hypothetical protein
MQLRQFVSGSAVILAGWLAITFVHEVPAQRYPKLDKYPAAARVAAPESLEMAAPAVDSAILQVSVSH